MRSVEDRIELAKAFVYTAEQQDEIVALMRPLYYSAEMFRDVFKPMLDEPRNDVSPIPASPEEACINRVTKKARRCLAAFLEPRMTAKREKEKYERYIAALELAAQELDAACVLRVGMINLDTYGPGPGLFLEDWLKRLQDGEQSSANNPFAETHELSAALRRHAGMAKRARDDIDEEYAADFIRTAHNPNRWRLAFDLLNQQTFETGNRPRRSRTSDAAKLLLAALDPVMIFASRILEIREAYQLLSGGNAENIIRRWEPPSRKLSNRDRPDTSHQPRRNPAPDPPKVRNPGSATPAE